VPIFRSNKFGQIYARLSIEPAGGGIQLCALSGAPPLILSVIYRDCEVFRSVHSRILFTYDMIYLTTTGLTPGGSSTVHIYTKTINRTTQSTQTIHRTTQFTN